MKSTTTKWLWGTGFRWLASFLTISACAVSGAIAADSAASKTYFEYKDRHYGSAREACEAVAKENRADKLVDNPYGQVIGSRDAGDSFWCKLQDKTGNETEQHYGRKVSVKQPKAGVDAESASSSKKDCEDLDGLATPRLKAELTTRVRRHMEAAHAEFVNNPSVAMEVLSGEEVRYIFGSGGYKYNPRQKADTITESAFNVLYGHALERLTARSVARDLCVSRYVRYQSAQDQMREGDNPDFVGQGKAKGLEIDITTPASAERKRKLPGKEKYEYLTYERGLRLDRNGVAVR